MELCQLLPSQFNKSLNLSSKQITRIGKLVQNSPFLNSQHLHISHNNISNLDGIEQFKQLKSLSLSNNQLVDINELKKVNRNLQYLSIHSNPFTVYDYHDVCYHLFRQLKRLDGMTVDMRIVKSQRIQAEVVSRWLIPWIYQLNNQMLNIQKLLSLRSATKEIDQRSQLKVVSNDLLLQIDWQFIDRMLSFLSSSTLQNLAKLLQSLQYSQELDQTQTKEMKKIHYETFQDVIKLQSSNHYAAFIDYLIRLNDDGDKTNYYKVFLNIQKPQLHISSDLYPKDDDLIPQEQPQKIIQTVPTFLKDKIKCQEVISNTYRKQRTIPDYEKEQFFQYFPVFPFRQEYIQSILQIATLKLTELKNLVSQVAYLKQNAIQSVPQSVRTLRKKQKVSEEPAPQKLNLKPQKPEVSPREEDVQPLEEQKITTRMYSDVKCEILRQRKALTLSVALEKIFGRRMKRFFSRINNLEQENTRFLDYPQVVYLSSLFYAMKRVLEQNKQKRQRQQKKRLMNLAFQGLKLLKYMKQREHKQVNKGYQVLQKLYFKRLVDGIRSMKHLLNYSQKTLKTQPFKLMLKQAPFQKSVDTIKFRRYNDENNENLKLCSVCTYQF